MKTPIEIIEDRAAYFNGSGSAGQRYLQYITDLELSVRHYMGENIKPKVEEDPKLPDILKDVDCIRITEITDKRGMLQLVQYDPIRITTFYRDSRDAAWAAFLEMIKK